MTEMLPREVIEWLDVPLAILVAVFCQILRPFIEPPTSEHAGWRETFRGDRVMVLPLLVGLLLGAVIESTTATWNWNVLIRRTLALGCGAAFAFKAAKSLWPRWFDGQ